MSVTVKQASKKKSHYEIVHVSAFSSCKHFQITRKFCLCFTAYKVLLNKVKAFMDCYYSI
jgi:hypothetical protein